MNETNEFEDVMKELQFAESKFPPFNSYHEGFAIIKEELDELWEEIKSKGRKKDNLYKEAMQVAAMAIRFMKLVSSKIDV